ncbi:MAG: hypothetical protein QOJ15_11097 [Bradyrhizobium sp.]|jgi:hypothetical protein|nr:hypothetical protein [Bradyrhizobium sp.]
MRVGMSTWARLGICPGYATLFEQIRRHRGSNERPRIRGVEPMGAWDCSPVRIGKRQAALGQYNGLSLSICDQIVCLWRPSRPVLQRPNALHQLRPFRRLGVNTMSDASIGLCHNIRSSGQQISAATVRQAIRCMSLVSEPAAIGRASHRLTSVRGRRIGSLVPTCAGTEV